MSKQFVKGNVYVFTNKKFNQRVPGISKISMWPFEINGNEVTVSGKNDGKIGVYGVNPKWCKCIKNNNPKIESEVI